MDEIYKTKKSKVLNLWETITPNVEGVGDRLRDASAEAIADYCFHTYYAQIAFRHIKVNSVYVMLDCEPDVDVFGGELCALIKKTFCGVIFASSEIDALIAKSFDSLKLYILDYWISKLEFYEAH